jgi:hypothetical protein
MWYFPEGNNSDRSVISAVAAVKVPCESVSCCGSSLHSNFFYSSIHTKSIYG